MMNERHAKTFWRLWWKKRGGGGERREREEDKMSAGARRARESDLCRAGAASWLGLSPRLQHTTFKPLVFITREGKARTKKYDSQG